MQAPPISPFDFVVSKHGSVYVAVNGATGLAEYTSNYFHEALQLALDSDLGRTTPLSFAVARRCSMVDTVWIPDHSHLYLFGAATGDDDRNYWFTNADHTRGNEDIRIYGPGSVSGMVFGPEGKTLNNQPFSFKGVVGLDLDGVEAMHSRTHCISARECNAVNVRHTRAHGSGDDCVSILSCSGVGITDNDIWNNRPDSQAGASGIEIEDASGVVQATQNRVRYVRAGIKVILDPGSVECPVDDLLLGSNILWDIEGNALALVGNKPAQGPVMYHSRNASVHGNIGKDIGGDMVSLSRVRGANIGNNPVDGCERGVYAGKGCRNIDIAHQSIRNAKSWGLMVYTTGSSEDEAIKDITVSFIDIVNPASAKPRHAMQFNGVHNLKLLHSNALDDRKGQETMKGIAKITDCSGHIFVEGLTGEGNTQGGVNPIIDGGGNSPIIGNDGSAFDATNVAVPA